MNSSLLDFFIFHFSPYIYIYIYISLSKLWLLVKRNRTGWYGDGVRVYPWLNHGHRRIPKYDRKTDRQTDGTTVRATDRQAVTVCMIDWWISFGGPRNRVLSVAMTTEALPGSPVGDGYRWSGQICLVIGLQCGEMSQSDKQPYTHGRTDAHARMHTDTHPHTHTHVDTQFHKQDQGWTQTYSSTHLNTDFSFPHTHNHIHEPIHRSIIIKTVS